MTLKEAVRSGQLEDRSIRRGSWDRDFVLQCKNQNDLVLRYQTSFNEERVIKDLVFPLSLDDIFAEDWETSGITYFYSNEY